jgi:hypothetical protein
MLKAKPGNGETTSSASLKSGASLQHLMRAVVTLTRSLGESQSAPSTDEDAQHILFDFDFVLGSINTTAVSVLWMSMVWVAGVVPAPETAKGRLSPGTEGSNAFLQRRVHCEPDFLDPEPSPTPPSLRRAAVPRIVSAIKERLLRRGTESSNSSPSSSQSVSAVNPEAVGEKPRTLAAVCGRLGTEKGRAGCEPGLPASSTDLSA